MWIILATKELSAFIAPLSSFTQSVVVVFILHTLKIGNLTEVSVMEMPASDTVFQEFLEINAHAHTVDTRRSFFPSPFSAPGNKAKKGSKKKKFVCGYVCMAREESGTSSHKHLL